MDGVVKTITKIWRQCGEYDNEDMALSLLDCTLSFQRRGFGFESIEIIQYFPSNYNKDRNKSF